jgi:HD domain
VLYGLKVAYIAHNGQLRKSGEPFIIHPVGVGILLAGLKMDCECIVAGLLHDTVEDTSLTFTQVLYLHSALILALLLIVQLLALYIRSVRVSNDTHICACCGDASFTISTAIAVRAAIGSATAVTFKATVLCWSSLSPCIMCV